MREEKESALDALNRQTMKKSVSYYATLSDLGESERVALASVADQVKGKRILDVGVGGGRTVSGLRAVSSDYLGVDYVPEMVEACQRRFPEARFEQADARSMPQFADHSFELVVFAWSGICMVDHEGRMAILREIRRILTPGGYFIFSTYNRNSAEHDHLFVVPQMALPKSVRGIAREIASFTFHTGVGLFNRIRNAHREVKTPEYSIINDRSHDYRTMLYYITAEEQTKQLARAGFRPDPAIFGGGRRLSDGDRVPGDTMIFVAQA